MLAYHALNYAGIFDKVSPTLLPTGLANVTNVHVADTAGSYQVYMYKTHFQQYSKLLSTYVVCVFY